MTFEIASRDENPPFPLLQGHLDFMCSIYAAINALHLVGDIREIDEAAIPFRLAVMFMQGAKDWDLGRGITEGIDPKYMNVLLQRLHWREVVRHKRKGNGISSAEIAEKLQPVDGRKRSAVLSLVDKNGYPHHYIAADIGDGGKIRLHDSQNPSQISFEGADIKFGEDEEKNQVFIRHMWVMSERNQSGS